MPQHPGIGATRRVALQALGATLVSPSMANMLPTQAGARRLPAAEIAAELPGARLVGSGRLTFLGLTVYDAHLWADETFKAEPFEQFPLALELGYARRLSGRSIAERSLDEMKRGGAISDEQGSRWLAAMQRIFPDVAAGDRVAGVLRPGVSARFFRNGEWLGEVRDAEFPRRFFGIWLAPTTSEPRLRLALLGPAASLPRAGT